MSTRHRDACASQGESHASSSITPPPITLENKSDMRAIKRGWYAAEGDGELSYGPFSRFEECVKRITQPTNGTVTCKCNDRRAEKLLYRHPALRAAS